MGFESFNPQTFLSSIRQSSRVDDPRTPFLLNQQLYLYFGDFSSQLDQWFCVPFLDQWSRSASLLQTSAISIFNLHTLPVMILAGVHRFLPRVLLKSMILIHFRLQPSGDLTPLHLLSPGVFHPKSTI
jgi:hypothetical protein